MNGFSIRPIDMERKGIERGREREEGRTLERCISGLEIGKGTRVRERKKLPLSLVE